MCVRCGGGNSESYCHQLVLTLDNLNTNYVLQKIATKLAKF